MKKAILIGILALVLSAGLVAAPRSQADNAAQNGEVVPASTSSSWPLASRAARLPGTWADCTA